MMYQRFCNLIIKNQIKFDEISRMQYLMANLRSFTMFMGRKLCLTPTLQYFFSVYCRYACYHRTYAYKIRSVLGMKLRLEGWLIRSDISNSYSLSLPFLASFSEKWFIVPPLSLSNFYPAKIFLFLKKRHHCYSLRTINGRKRWF